tara:strand:+ start:114 stop:473 length:360 start_codon:yes stop_codon:yes gene_type:complete
MLIGYWMEYKCQKECEFMFHKVFELNLEIKNLKEENSLKLKKINMLNVLNRDYVKAENIIYNIREKENELFREYLNLCYTKGETHKKTLELRHKWVVLNNIMKDSKVKTIAEIKVEQND